MSKKRITSFSVVAGLAFFLVISLPAFFNERSSDEMASTRADTVPLSSSSASGEPVSKHANGTNTNAAIGDNPELTAQQQELVSRIRKRLDSLNATKTKLSNELRDKNPVDVALEAIRKQRNTMLGSIRKYYNEEWDDFFSRNEKVLANEKKRVKNLSIVSGILIGIDPASYGDELSQVLTHLLSDERFITRTLVAAETAALAEGLNGKVWKEKIEMNPSDDPIWRLQTAASILEELKSNHPKNLPKEVNNYMLQQGNILALSSVIDAEILNPVFKPINGLRSSMSRGSIDVLNDLNQLPKNSRIRAVLAKQLHDIIYNE